MALRDILVTCGLAYSGQALPTLKERLIYADYVRGAIWTIPVNDSFNISSRLLVKNAGNITSFCSDDKGEMYYTDFTSGNIMKLIPKKSIHDDFS